MSKHQLTGSWYRPSSGTRFFTQSGELVNVETGKTVASVDRKILVGAAHDIEDGS